MPSLKYVDLSREAFDDILSRYASTVPERLRELDTQRYEIIPGTLATRVNEQDASLYKEEVEKLVEWKLKHGTFRPKLLQLVQSNPDALVRSTTHKALSLFIKDPASSAVAALKVLTDLKGIGPATASLLLSAYAPDIVPFFSDEVFRWVMWDEPGKPGGWKRVIKYNAKEFEEVLRRVGEMRERLGLKAVEVEKVAYVLGKEGVELGKGEDEQEEAKTNVVDGRKVDRKDEGKAVKEKSRNIVLKQAAAQKKGTKRKVAEEKTPVESVRRSNRRKVSK